MLIVRFKSELSMKGYIIRQVDSDLCYATSTKYNKFQGGKADDISVIVAIVKDCEDSPDRRL